MLKISALTVGLGLLIGVSGCQTFSGLGDSIGEALGTRQAEILESQKSIVVNYLDQGKPQAALPEVRRLVQEHPNNAEVLNLAGLTHLSLKNSRVAVRYFELSLDRKSEPGVALNLSSALIETKQFDRASKVLRDLIVDGSVREYRYRERIFHNLGVIAQQSGKPQLAAKYYDRAIEENPVFYKSHLQKARMYAQSGNLTMALESSEKAFESCPRCYEALEAVVKSSLALKNKTKAMAAVQTFLRNDELPNEDKRRVEDLRDRLKTMR